MSFLRTIFRRPQESDSLHGEMYRLDVVEELLRDGLNAYQALIDLMVTHVPKVARELGREHKKRLKSIRNLLDSKPSKALIDEVRQQLEAALGTFTKTLDQQLGQQEQETKQVMAIVAVMAESMADREKQYNVRFRCIGKKLRALTTSDDIAEIRRKLEAEVIQLEKYVDEMAHDTDSAVSRMQMELRQTMKPAPAPRPVEAESGAPKPLAVRYYAEQALESRRDVDKRFCAARFRIDNIDAVTIQLGLPAAAGLMDQVGEIIRQRFKPADLVCRWSDGDLITITDLGLPEVAMRIADLDASLAGPYTSGSCEVTLAVRTCVIERIRGERVEETIERIDSMLSPEEILPAAARK